MIGDYNSSNFIKILLEKNLRMDGRQLFQTRNIKIEFLDKPGCLLYSQGQTQVIIKARTEIVLPKPQRPSEGFVYFKVNCMSCPRSYDQNRKVSNELNKLLEKVIIGSNCLDPESLCILTGKYVWELVIDCIVVQDFGNLIDSVLNSTIVSLMDMKKPLVSIQKLNVIYSKKQLPLSIAHTPISFTFGLFQDCIFLDPVLEQQQCSQTRVTISINVYNEICSIHKPGGKGVTENMVAGMIKVCQSQVKQVTNKIREGVEKRMSIICRF